MSLLERIGNLAWALRQSADIQTVRALRGRLRPEERELQSLRVRLRSVKAPLMIRPRTTDKAVLWMMFRDQEYRPIAGWAFKTVLDCGANIGLFAAYARMCAGSLLAYVGVEPDPDRAYASQ